MGLDYDTSTSDSFPAWLLQRLSLDSPERVVQITKVLWGIWSSRNMLIWENKLVTAEIAMEWSTMQVYQWQQMQSHKCNNGGARVQGDQGVISRWIPPEAGRLKINVDAYVFAGTSSYSIGMVLRDHLGSFCKARSLRKRGQVSVFEAETQGVLEAIDWGTALGLANVDIDTDFMLTMKAITGNSSNVLEVGNMIEEGRMSLNVRRDFSLNFVRKQANKVAHLLARVPCQVNCFNEFFLLHVWCWRT